MKYSPALKDDLPIERVRITVERDELVIYKLCPDLTGISPSTINYRLKKNLPIEKVFE